jgi:predicted permease
MAAFRSVALEVAVQGEVAERVSGAVASGSFFEVLDVAPRYGRLFSEEDDGERGSNLVAVLSERFWRREFGGRPDAVGSVIQINGLRYTVVGVAPRSVEVFERAPQIWLPMSMATVAEPILATQIDRWTNDFFKVLARRKPGTSIEQAQVELQVVGARLGAGRTMHLSEGMEREQEMAPGAAPPAGAEEYDWKRPWVGVAPAKKGFGREEARLCGLLVGVALLLLLIATLDVGTLWLARAEQEEKEAAVRAALGALRWDLLRAKLAEGFLVAVVGGLAGVLVASWSARLLYAAAPEGLPLPIETASTFTSLVTLRVGIFVTAVTFLACLAPSLLAAFGRSRGILESLKMQSAASTIRRGSRAQSILVLAQMATSFVLLVCAGLLIETMRNVARIDLGFDTEQVLSATLDLSRHGYTKSQGAALLPPLIERLRAIPGAASVALMAGSPVEWRPKALGPKASACDNLPLRMVSPAYFSTLRIPLLRGRDFAPSDRKGAAGVAIVNQAAREMCWPGQEPLGQKLPGLGILGGPFQIIGVAGNVRVDEQADAPRPQVYAPIAQFYEGYPWQFSISLLVRTELPPRAISAAVAAAVRSLDANLVLYDVETPRELLGRAYEREAFLMRVLAVFGLLAFMLAIAGLYGLLAYTTSRRTREFGIRRAFGAETRDILRLVIAEGGRLAVLGVAVGLGAAVALSRLLRGLLYGVAGTDSATLAAVAILFLAVALAACSMPARRAARVDPLRALRDE